MRNKSRSWEWTEAQMEENTTLIIALPRQGFHIRIRTFILFIKSSKVSGENIISI
jgi:hypothetical protein